MRVVVHILPGLLVVTVYTTHSPSIIVHVQNTTLYISHVAHLNVNIFE